MRNARLTPLVSQDEKIRRAKKKHKRKSLKRLADNAHDLGCLPHEIASSIDDDTHNKLTQLRGGCSCFISPPCANCVDPITFGEGREIGLVGIWRDAMRWSAKQKVQGGPHHG